MFLDVLINAVLGFSFLCYTLLVGYGALRFCGAITDFKEEQKRYHFNTFFSLVLGMVITILALMVLGYCGFLNTLAVSLVGVVLLVAALRFGKVKLANIFLFSRLESIALILIYFLAIAFSWHPPGHWDDTSFHLPLARFYLEQEAIVLHEFVRFPLFPQNMNMLITLGLMLGDTPTAQLFATLPWFVTAIGLMALCKQLMGSSLVGIFIAVLIAKEVGAIKSGFGYAYVDIGLALFCWAALLAVIHYWQLRKNNLSNHFQWLVVAGFFTGAAAGTKLFGGVFAFILMLCILYISRSLKLCIVFGVAVLVAGIWWYLRSYLISGDPFHPAGGNIFGYFLWNEDDLSSQVSAQNAFGLGSNPLQIIAVLEKINTEIFLLAFLGFLLKGLSPVVRLMQLVFISYFCFWFFVAQIERYLAPVVVLGSFLAFYTLFFVLAFFVRKVNWRLFKEYSFHLPIVILPIFFLAFLCLLLGKEIEDSKERFRVGLLELPGYELFSKASELTPSHGNRMVQIGFENAAYFFTGITIGDWFGVARYSQMLACAEMPCAPVDEKTMVKLMDKFNSNLLAVSLIRYPSFNADQYMSEFTVVMRNSQGVLLLRKAVPVDSFPESTK